MKRTRKILATVLSLVMILTALSLTAITSFAETSGDFWYYVLDDGTAAIGSYSGSATELIIPSEIDGYTVTRIGDWALSDHSSLASITIPDSITNIVDSAFCGCTSLTSINVNTGNENYVSVDGILFNKDKTELIRYPAGKKATTYVIPNSVTSIGGWAFEQCTSLASVTIPDSLTSIGNGAFEFCTSLASVTIPDSVTSIGDYAFYNTAYYNNESNWENDVLYIGNYLINAQDTISGDYTIKDGTKLIADYTFFWCTSLTSITIPDSVTSIGYSAFEGCTSLTSVTIPDSVTNIGYKTFYGCTSLVSVTIPDSVTSIAEEAFGYYYDAFDEVIYKIEGFTIYGYAGSEAEIYANENDFVFVSLGEVQYPQPPQSDAGTGDVNGDNYVSILDVNWIYENVSGLRVFDENQKSQADINGDGDVDIDDADYVLHNIVTPSDYIDVNKPICGAAPNEYGNTKGTVTLSSPKIKEYTMDPIDNYVVTADIYFSEGFCGAFATIEIDTEVLEYVEGSIRIDDNDALLAASNLSFVMPENKYLRFAFSDLEPNENGYHVTADFFVKSWESDYEQGMDLTGNGDYCAIPVIAVEPEKCLSLEIRDSIDYEGKLVDIENNGEYSLGDVNGDGKLSTVDAKWILQNLASTRDFTAEQKAFADVNGDGKISTVDAKWVLQVVAGIRDLDDNPTPPTEDTYIDMDNPVIDALNYEREVIPADPEYDDYEGVKHKVVIPKINGNTENVIEFNKKIFESYEDTYNILLNYEEESRLFNIGYYYTVQNGIVSIIVEDIDGLQFSEYYKLYDCYYYDLENDCELTMDEYLDKLGTTEDDLKTRFEKTDEYKEFNAFCIEMNGSGYDTVIIGCAIDEFKAYIVVYYDEALFSNEILFCINDNIIGEEDNNNSEFEEKLNGYWNCEAYRGEGEMVFAHDVRFGPDNTVELISCSDEYGFVEGGTYNYTYAGPDTIAFDYCYYIDSFEISGHIEITDIKNSNCLLMNDNGEEYILIPETPNYGESFTVGMENTTWSSDYLSEKYGQNVTITIDATGSIHYNIVGMDILNPDCEYFAQYSSDYIAILMPNMEGKIVLEKIDDNTINAHFIVNNDNDKSEYITTDVLQKI